MGRRREFDQDAAIERATRLFWAKGYSGTSLRELLKVMRIGESSFYNLVSSKQALYLLCLKHYNETITRRRWEALLSEPQVRRGLRRFFAMVLDELDDPKTPNVCLMAGSLSSEVLSIRELERYVIAEMQALQGALRMRLEAARAAGELPTDFDAETAAATLVTFLQGFYRTIRVLNDRPHMARQVEALLTGLGL